MEFDSPPQELGFILGRGFATPQNARPSLKVKPSRAFFQDLADFGGDGGS